MLPSKTPAIISIGPGPFAGCENNCLSEILSLAGIHNYRVLQIFGDGNDDNSSIETNHLSCSMVASGSVVFLGEHSADLNPLPAPAPAPLTAAPAPFDHCSCPFDFYCSCPFNYETPTQEAPPFIQWEWASASSHQSDPPPRHKRKAGDEIWQATGSNWFLV